MTRHSFFSRKDLKRSRLVEGFDFVTLKTFVVHFHHGWSTWISWMDFECMVFDNWIIHIIDIQIRINITIQTKSWNINQSMDVTMEFIINHLLCIICIHFYTKKKQHFLYNYNSVMYIHPTISCHLFYVLSIITNISLFQSE